MEEPHKLLRRLKLGREEYCQRLLTMLVLDADYPRWNTRSTPSPAGLRFLRALDALSFGTADLPDDAVFVDELDLPRRDEDEPGCAPDYGVLTAGRLWIIELKTERGSDRHGQVESYFELGRHHHPERRIDLTYLTPGMSAVSAGAPAGSRLAQVTWEQVMPLVDDVWAGVTGSIGELHDALAEAVASIGTSWTMWREKSLNDLTTNAARLARLTARDGQQRALDHMAGSLGELQRLRLAVRDEFRRPGSPLGSVEPWLWDASTSGGTALTQAGRVHGYELRFSRVER
ncbi:hypothetical protein [Nocardioides euryhalodurans]|uniref:Uncharacterized protein n=1 Tax=Nocardioides euryhalodurans TaxID=2518370 RepID=A0A4P7GKF7_9ACTN|nr:hypothetical protein [Nocardioides euryhalodurans]QBR92269.1 hypothetical protein EXE57_08190 [Nocardioides euryhalodurans]